MQSIHLNPPLEQPELTEPPLLLLVGSNHDFLANQLAVLAPQLLRPLVILIPTDEAHYFPELRQDVLYTLKREYFKAGFYQHYWHSPPVTVLEIPSYEILKHQSLWQQCASYFLNVDNFNVQAEETLTLSLSPIMICCETILQSQGLEMDEDLLMALVENYSPGLRLGLLRNAWRDMADCAEQCAQLPIDTDLWATEWGPQYRYLQDLALCKHPELHSQRSVFNPLIVQAHAQPTHWPLQAALLLYKRFCTDTKALVESAPPWFQTLYEHYQQHHGRHLEILPPIAEQTVTVLILTFNRLHLLPRTVESVLAQTYPHWKLIIGDGGSTDGTQAYGEALAASDPRITYLWRDFPRGSSGVSATQILLYETAQTEWVVIACDDDWLAPDHLEKSMAMAQQYPWTGMVFGTFQMLNESMMYVGQYGPLADRSGPLDPYRALREGPVRGLCPQMCLHRRSLIQRVVFPLMQLAYQTNEPMGWDYVFAMYLYGHFEIIHIPAVTAYLTSDENTFFSGAHTDFSDTFLRVFETVNQAFLTLFGEPYPADLAQIYFEQILKPCVVNHLTRFLTTATTAEDLETLFHAKKQLWLRFAQVARTMKLAVRQGGDK